MLHESPMARDEALRALGYIRAAIDRTTRYSTFSAWSGFIAGTAALAGSGGCGWAVENPGCHPLMGPRFLGVWLGVFAVAAVTMLILTALKAQQRGERMWTPIARTAFGALLGPGMAGLVATLALARAERYDLLPGLWLTMYGCGLYVASFFAPLFMRTLGLIFLALGAAAWWTPVEWSAVWLGLGFGGLHFAFGTIVMWRYCG